jgi:natural product biosynthesis luciferase-like monooxygenase protein
MMAWSKGPMEFGVMFFSTIPRHKTVTEAYRLLCDATVFADEHDFCCVWTPERHFHEFGGLFPNPSVVNAALAMITKRLQLRAGSLISPLHDPIRVAEEWALVDNMSNGRAAISFGSGWNVNDFVLFPERYTMRKEIMYEQIGLIQKLWQGETVDVKNPLGKAFALHTYPRPLQKTLPVWVTTSGSPDTFVSAGAIGANILTHLLGQDIEQLGEKIQLYRGSLAKHGFDPDQHVVSLMLHTFLGEEIEAVKAMVKQPFSAYLKSALHLEEKAARGGGVISGGHTIQPSAISDQAMEDLLEATFQRYFYTASLLGTLQSCTNLVWRLQEVGVNEIACLIDFIDDYAAILKSLRYVNELRLSFTKQASKESSSEHLSAFMEDIDE